MHPADIQAEMKKRGISQQKLAHDLAVTQETVSKVVNKHCISDRVMRAVAAAIDKPVALVFPEYYLSPPKRTTSKVAA